jgi:uncharacterized protein YjbI with pentapeptide repeats
MQESTFDGANFTDANLTGAYMQESSFRGAIFTGAQIDGAFLQESDFSGATWIDGESVCAEGSIGGCTF